MIESYVEWLRTENQDGKKANATATERLRHLQAAFNKAARRG